ncbi:MAG: RdgB/HAM1 family non-canonical purine NTP pyrophosphatase [Flavobacteriales bacterium]|nr:RdgB/HAM1 family non-canonical purine NTP pyrophosphatase [Flavobacteriales bacterium]
MNKLILATHNEHKAEEFKQILPQFRVQTLADLNYDQEITETASDLEGNSLLKADTIFRQYGHIVISDDSGLEVQALNGAPGVYSARYAGEQKDDQKNIEKLLHELKGITNRNAQFRTVITLMGLNDTLQFEGIVEGTIVHEPKGDKGFGYDPVFIPNGFQKTFAELSSNEKNKISHRANAIEKLVAFIEKNPTFC